MMLALSVVPYAFTWHIDGGGEWRFTMLAYPIYLIASALAIAGGGCVVVRRAAVNRLRCVRPGFW